MNTIVFAILLAATVTFHVLLQSQLPVIAGLIVGIAIGGGCFWFCKLKSINRIRPIVYWPTIGLLAHALTKGGGDLSAFIFWIGIAVPVGLAFEWRERKDKRYLIAAALVMCVCAILCYSIVDQLNQSLVKIEYSN